MKIKEIISERKKFTRGQQGAIPDFEQYPQMGANDYYSQYRFGIAMANAPSPLYSMTPEGPTGDNFVTLAYSDADKKIIDNAKRMMGQKTLALSSRKSKENLSVNTQSPIKPQPPVKRKNK
jgi:hypothetical protein